jgi:hypothetical protein
MAQGKKTGGRTKGTPNRKPGRPSLYSQALAEKICEALASGLTLKEVLAADDMPAERTVHTWRKDKPDFAEIYTFAMQRHCHHTFDHVWGIAKDRSGDTRVVDGKTVADTARVQRDRLIVDTGFKRCAKLLPTIYGDLVRLSGPDGGPIKSESSDLDIARRIAFALAQGRAAANASNVLRPPAPSSEAKPEPPSEPKREPPAEPPHQPDVRDPITGHYISAKEWLARWPNVPPPQEPPQPLYSTAEVVFLYDEAGRPHRTDTTNKLEQGMQRNFTQVITRRPG